MYKTELMIEVANLLIRQCIFHSLLTLYQNRTTVVSSIYKTGVQPLGQSGGNSHSINALDIY